MKNCMIAFMIMIMVGGLFAAATVYDVELSYNDYFNATQARQTFIATADSISEAVFFCGRKIIPGQYIFRIRDSLGGPLPGNPTAYSDSAGLFDYELVSATFGTKVHLRKGIKYRLAVTHSDPSCTTNFYYNRDNPYDNGELIGHSGWDLAARIKGFNNFPS